MPYTLSYHRTRHIFFVYLSGDKSHCAGVLVYSVVTKIRDNTTQPNTMVVRLLVALRYLQHGCAAQETDPLRQLLVLQD